MKVILYANDDGWVSVVTPCYPADITQEQEAEILAWVRQKDVPPLPDGSPRPSVVKEPKDVADMDYFFSAWRLDASGRLTWNKAAADAMKRDQFRALRKPRLEALDVDFMRALERGDTASLAEIAAQKQALRDVTSTDLSLYTSPKSLYEYLPETLQ
jgi:hypothetical protein